MQHAMDTKDELEGSVRPAEEGGMELETEAEGATQSWRRVNWRGQRSWRPRRESWRGQCSKQWTQRTS